MQNANSTQNMAASDYALKAGALTAGARLAEVSPTSPVQIQLQRLNELISELHHAVNCLCDPLLSVLHHDPREALEAQGGVSANPPTSCDLERTLMMYGDTLQSTIRRARDIGNAIRL